MKQGTVSPWSTAPRCYRVLQVFPTMSDCESWENTVSCTQDVVEGGCRSNAPRSEVASSELIFSLHHLSTKELSLDVRMMWFVSTRVLENAFQELIERWTSSWSMPSYHKFSFGNSSSSKTCEFPKDIHWNEKWSHFESLTCLKYSPNSPITRHPGQILVPLLTQLFRSKWLHFFFQCLLTNSQSQTTLATFSRKAASRATQFSS